MLLCDKCAMPGNRCIVCCDVPHYDSVPLTSNYSRFFVGVLTSACPAFIPVHLQGGGGVKRLTSLGWLQLARKFPGQLQDDMKTSSFSVNACAYNRNINVRNSKCVFEFAKFIT